GGEPGIGKTRLAVELGRRAHDGGTTVLYGRCDEDVGVPYQPFIQTLGAYAVRCPPHVLADHVRVHGGELARIVPEVARRVPDIPPVPGADAEMARYRLFESVRGFLERACEENPLALILDDLHWAPAPTLAMLRHIVRSSLAGPLLLVGTYRTTDVDESHPLQDLLADL